jgi:hypothetical protein
MSKQVILSMLAQGNTGDEILSILDVIVSDIEQEGIDSCAEVFANWFTLTVSLLTNTQEHNMSKSLMISLLSKGNNGSEILSILDAIVADNVSEVADSTYLPILGQSVPTLEEIAFWM